MKNGFPSLIPIKRRRNCLKFYRMCFWYKWTTLPELQIQFQKFCKKWTAYLSFVCKWHILIGPMYILGILKFVLSRANRVPVKIKNLSFGWTQICLFIDQRTISFISKGFGASLIIMKKQKRQKSVQNHLIGHGQICLFFSVNGH